jgi:hypothetical protein
MALVDSVSPHLSNVDVLPLRDGPRNLSKPRRTVRQLKFFLDKYKDHIDPIIFHHDLSRNTNTFKYSQVHNTF